jgi:hypothetical protein
MPKVPTAVSQRSISTGNIGSINAPSNMGRGAQQIGAGLMNVSQSANFLMHSALAAERQREAEAKHLDELNQQQGANLLALEAQQGIDDDVRGLKDQLSKQTDRSPMLWRAKIRNQGDDEIEVMPDDAVQLQLRNRIDKAIQTAEDAYGPKAKALVEQYLRPHAFKATSEFKDYTFGLKVDKGKADLSTSLDILGKQAADPHNLMREDSMQRGLDLIDNAKVNGLLPPTDVAKLKQNWQADVGGKYWQTVSQLDPTKILQLESDYRTKGAHLPEGMDPTKLDTYRQMAYGTLDRSQRQRDAMNKAHEEAIKATQEQNYRGLYSQVLQRDPKAVEALPEMMATQGLTVEQADKIRSTAEHLAKQDADNPALKQSSGLARFEFQKQVTRAKFGDGDLSAIENDLTDQVTSGQMLATDAQAIMSQINEAQGHLQSEEKKSYNDDVQRAHKNVMSALTTTGIMDKFDALSEETKKNADEYFYKRLAQEPNANPWQIREETLKIFEPILKQRKEVGMQEGDKLKLDDARIEAGVQSGALSKAAAKAMRDQTQQDIGMRLREQFIKSYVPPQPSMMERIQQFGSSLFQGSDE